MPDAKIIMNAVSILMTLFAFISCVLVFFGTYKAFNLSAEDALWGNGLGQAAPSASYFASKELISCDAAGEYNFLISNNASQVCTADDCRNPHQYCAYGSQNPDAGCMPEEAPADGGLKVLGECCDDDFPWMKCSFYACNDNMCNGVPAVDGVPAMDKGCCVTKLQDGQPCKWPEYVNAQFGQCLSGECSGSGNSGTCKTTGVISSEDQFPKTIDVKANLPEDYTPVAMPGGSLQPSVACELKQSSTTGVTGLMDQRCNTNSECVGNNRQCLGGQNQVGISSGTGWCSASPTEVWTEEEWQDRIDSFKADNYAFCREDQDKDYKEAPGEALGLFLLLWVFILPIHTFAGPYWRGKFATWITLLALVTLYSLVLYATHMYELCQSAYDRWRDCSGEETLSGAWYLTQALGGVPNNLGDFEFGGSIRECYAYSDAIDIHQLAQVFQRSIYVDPLVSAFKNAVRCSAAGVVMGWITMVFIILMGPWWESVQVENTGGGGGGGNMGFAAQDGNGARAKELVGTNL